MQSRFLFPCMLLAAVVSASCGDDGGGGGPEPDAGEFTGPSRAEVLARIGEGVVCPTYRDFEARAAAMVEALDAYAAAPDATTRTSAQQAWIDAMGVWQLAEVMHIGPAAPMDAALGGADVRDEIYAYPSLNLCLIDQRTVGEDHDDPDALAANAVNERGLGAIEYLIFVESTENNCSPGSGINIDGSWDALTPEQLEQRRARLAHSLGVVVHRHARDLATRWAPDGGNFLAELTDPTRSGALYGSAQEGLNAVSAAMHYIDTETKDMKLAEPAGIGDACMAATCPEARESRFASRSKEHVVANLRAFQLLYHGGEPGGEDPGFDDLLRGLGAGDFADQMATHIAGAITAVEAIPGTLAEAIASDLEAVTAAHAAVRLVTTDLKTMFITILDLEPPMDAAGDTD